MELISLAKLHWILSNIKFERFYMDDIENLISNVWNEFYELGTRRWKKMEISQYYSACHEQFRWNVHSNRTKIIWQ